MNNKSLMNLKPIHLKPKGDPRSDAIRAKLKGSASPKRKLSQKINAMNRGGPNKMSIKNIEKRAMQLATDPNVSAVNIMRMIENLNSRDDLDPDLRIRLIGVANDSHRTIFGTHQKIDQRIESITVTINRPKKLPKKPPKKINK